MDTILVIINALKIDKTVFIQFAILIVFFNTIAPLFFKKVQAVLELREGKTTKLETHAHEIYKKAEGLAEQYRARVEKTHQESQETNHKKKSEISNVERDILKAEEGKLSAEYEQRSAQIQKEMAAKRATVMAEADKLSGNLVEKLTK